MYELFYTDKFKKDAKRLDRTNQEILKKVIAKIMENPKRFKPIQRGMPRFRIRFNVYRLLYSVEGNMIKLLRVGNRDSIYD